MLCIEQTFHLVEKLLIELWFITSLEILELLQNYCNQPNYSLPQNGHPKHRYALFPEYKANRLVKLASKQDKNELFNINKNIVFELLQYLPVTIWKSNDYEADDVIYTLCQNLKDEEVTVLSNDSDFIQLLQEFKHVNIYNPIKKIYMEAPVYHYGIWKSLAGDKSDNIPKLISDKKAQNLAGNPDLLKNYLENEEFRSNFSINYELIKFKSIDFSEINTVVGVASYDKLFDKFKEFEFNSITNDKSREKFISTFGDL